tara:strand:- start:1361 stop:1585 length:225 start_codon:yes stop_codon:yes gene_type:complete
MHSSISNIEESDNNVVTSFQTNKENWKKLKVLATIDGVAVKDKLNEVIESYLSTNYTKVLNNTSGGTDGQENRG